MGVRGHVVEISLSPDGSDALVAYADPALDAALALRLDHDSGELQALAPSGAVPCGLVSARMSARLLPLRRVLWCRREGESSIAVSEIGLEHRGR